MAYNKKYSDIIVNRYGDKPNSNMTTTHIINEVHPYTSYYISTVNLHYSKKQPKYTNVPDGPNKWINIPNNWDDSNNFDTKESNILGHSGTIYLDDNILNIPISYNYSFFGIKMYKVGDIIQFKDIYTSLPVCNVDIGNNYIKDYIMKKAGGVYLEYHDRPHFHMPRDRDAHGYIIIGKKHDDKILLAAFKIPYGYALYTPGNVIHNDCFLVGRYLVVYSKTDFFSNVLLKTKNNTPVQVNIVN